MGDQTFDGVRVVVVRVAGGVVGDGANHPGLLRAGDVEVAGRPSHDDDVVRSCMPGLPWRAVQRGSARTIWSARAESSTVSRGWASGLPGGDRCGARRDWRWLPRCGWSPCRRGWRRRGAAYGWRRTISLGGSSREMMLKRAVAGRRGRMRFAASRISAALSGASGWGAGGGAVRQAARTAMRTIRAGRT